MYISVVLNAHIHIVLQPSPPSPSTSRTFHHRKLKFCAHLTVAPHSPTPQPLATTPCSALNCKSTFFFFLFFYFWLCWVFIAVRGLSLVAVSGGYSLLRCAGFLLEWLLLLRSTGSRRAGFSSCGSRALERRISNCGARA